MSAGILGFILGMFVGGFFGIFVIALLTASKDEKERYGNEKNSRKTDS